MTPEEMIGGSLTEDRKHRRNTTEKAELQMGNRKSGVTEANGEGIPLYSILGDCILQTIYSSLPC